MADLTALDDIDHDWSGDVAVSLSGDLNRANRLTRSRQRVLRRLLTNPGDYIWHPTYGAGLPAQIGRNLDLAKLRALIRGQMLLEPSVLRSPEPTIVLKSIANGVAVRISYIALPDRQPVALSFSVSV
jgi:hypothetical protein